MNSSIKLVPTLTILLLFLPSAFPLPSYQSLNCESIIIFTALGDNCCSRSNQFDSQTNVTVAVQWQCPDLQSALTKAVNLSSGYTAEIPERQNCVAIAVPPGDHLLKAPIYFNVSRVHIYGSGEKSQNSSIFCNYSVNVNLTRIFDPDYVYTDYTFYFNNSEMVSFENVQLVGCPYPLRLDSIVIVRVHNSIFRQVSSACISIMEY